MQGPRKRAKRTNAVICRASRVLASYTAGDEHPWKRNDRLCLARQFETHVRRLSRGVFTHARELDARSDEWSAQQSFRRRRKVSNAICVYVSRRSESKAVIDASVQAQLQSSLDASLLHPCIIFPYLQSDRIDRRALDSRWEPITMKLIVHHVICKHVHSQQPYMRYMRNMVGNKLEPDTK